MDLHDRSWICSLLSNTTLSPKCPRLSCGLQQSPSNWTPAPPCCPLYSTQHDLIKNTNHFACLKLSKDFLLYFKKVHQALRRWPLPASLTYLQQDPDILILFSFPPQDFCNCYSGKIFPSCMSQISDQMSPPQRGLLPTSCLLPPRHWGIIISLMACIAINKHHAYLFVCLVASCSASRFSCWMWASGRCLLLCSRIVPVTY